jgi:hypothetical protein
MPDITEIDLAYGSINHILLTTRNGDVIDEGCYPDRWHDWRIELTNCGLTRSMIQACFARAASHVKGPYAFLVYRDAAPGTSYERIEDGIHVMAIEMFAGHETPSSILSTLTSEQDLQDWRASLKANTPAVLRFARYVQSTCASDGVHAFFDMDEIRHGDLGFYLPMNALHHYQGLADCLASCCNAPPASNHDLIEATPRLRWRYDSAIIPAAALPGISAPLPLRAASQPGIEEQSHATG